MPATQQTGVLNVAYRLLPTVRPCVQHDTSTAAAAVNLPIIVSNSGRVCARLFSIKIVVRMCLYTLSE